MRREEMPGGQGYDDRGGWGVAPARTLAVKRLFGASGGYGGRGMPGRGRKVALRKPPPGGDAARAAGPYLFWAICFIHSAWRLPISPGGTSSMWVAIPQWWPNGSATFPNRSPQNMSLGGMMLRAPASTARL